MLMVERMRYKINPASMVAKIKAITSKKVNEKNITATPARMYAIDATNAADESASPYIANIKGMIAALYDKINAGNSKLFSAPNSTNENRTLLHSTAITAAQHVAKYNIATVLSLFRMVFSSPPNAVDTLAKAK